MCPPKATVTNAGKEPVQVLLVFFKGKKLRAAFLSRRAIKPPLFVSFAAGLLMVGKKTPPLKHVSVNLIIWGHRGSLLQVATSHL